MQFAGRPRSLIAFRLSVLTEAAQQAISRHEALVRGTRPADIFDAPVHPPKPDARLRRAFTSTPRTHRTTMRVIQATALLAMAVAVRAVAQPGTPPSSPPPAASHGYADREPLFALVACNPRRQLDCDRRCIAKAPDPRAPDYDRNLMHQWLLHCRSACEKQYC
jgi:hypothetical protein